MTRLMYDADRPGDIPRDAEMVAGYVDGSWSKWDPSWWGWFPRSKFVTISAVGAVWNAQVFDVEPGAIWPPENVLQLIVTARSRGLWPSVYCNQSNHWAYIRNMFRMRGMVEPPYWVSNYDGIAVIPDGAVAKQFAHPPQTGKHYDVSIVRDEWPGVDYLPGDDVPLTSADAELIVQVFLNTWIDDPRSVPDSDKHPTTVRNALWSTWHTLHYGDSVFGIYPSLADLRDAIVAQGTLPTKEEILEGIKDRVRFDLRASGNITVSPADQST